MDIILTTPEQLHGIIQKAVKEAIKNFPTPKAESNSEILLTRREAADKLKISLVTLNEWSKRGLLKSYIIGGRVFYKESELEDSLNLVKTVKY